MEKNVWIAYLLWFFGGWFGLHHLYLKRDRHAFVWWCLIAGYGAIGWFHDISRIKRYVREANMTEQEYADMMTRVSTERPKPKFSLTRFLAQMATGNMLAWVIYRAIPEEEVGGYSWTWLQILIPLGSAIGVHTVGNLGHQKGSLLPALFAAYLPYLFYTYDNPNYYVSTFLAAVVFSYYRRWREERPNKHMCKRVATLTVCLLLYSSLWGSFLYFNVEITNEHGETVKFRDAFINFLKSPLWMELYDSMSKLWMYYKINGWTTMWSEFMTYLDPLGERNAMRVLQLSSSASQEEITQQWRKLSRQYHPDKFRNPEEKAEAQEKFLQIQQAYEKVSSLNSKRKRQRSKNNEEL